MKLIVGLGNPGHTFHHTRHNAGFMVMQWLEVRHRVRIEHRVVNPVDGRPAAVFGEYQDGAEAVRLMMPLTMMNESGDALRQLEAPRQDVLIVCDDVNLPLGTLRLRPQGGAGGHHGLASCLAILQTEEVARLRLGVGVTPLPKDLEDFVLSPFASAERPLMQRMIEQAGEACEVWAKEGIEVAMNRYNKVPES